MVAWGPKCDELVKEMKKNRHDEKRILELIEQIEDPNATHEWREAEFSLLFHASLEECPVAFDALLKKGADPTFLNDNGTSVLSLMIKRRQFGLIRNCIVQINDMDRVKEWLSLGTKSGWTPLMAAVDKGDHRVVQLMLKHGADVNQPMSTGWTALHAAAKNANIGIFQALLKAGGDPSLQAVHRDFGENVSCEDVTTNPAIHRLCRSMAVAVN